MTTDSVQTLRNIQHRAEQLAPALLTKLSYLAYIERQGQLGQTWIHGRIIVEKENYDVITGHLAGDQVIAAAEAHSPPRRGVLSHPDVLRS